MITLTRTNSEDPAFRSLVILLDADLKIRDGEEHSFYNQFNQVTNISNVVVCYNDNNAIGCGAFKNYDTQTAEIKRMFIRLENRGKGVGLLVLNELEKWAHELNYKKYILETGKKQPEAIRLYEKAGYHIIENYGQYKNMENSVCMQKKIPDVE